MEIENLAGNWPNVAINPATGKTYESEYMDKGESDLICPYDSRKQIEEDIFCYRVENDSQIICVPIYRVKSWLNRQADITWNNACEIQSKNIAELTDEIAYLRKVCQTQADSFAAIENENAELRSKLNRIRELAERLQDA